MVTSNKKVGTKIRDLRIKNRYSKIDFANLMGVSLRTVYRWEEGVCKIRETNIIRICEVLGVSIRFFSNDD